MAGRTVEIDEHEVELSNPDKPLYPADGLTKIDVVDYYRRVAETMLVHLRGRPLTLRRFPDGIEENGFFQKQASDYFPEWIRTVEVPQRTESGTVRQVVCDDAATLVYLANQGCLEFHAWLSTAEALDCPDRLVVDLDPADGIGLRELRDTTRRVGDTLAALDLVPFAQTTGSRGFHVAAPLDGSVAYDEVRDLAHEVAHRLAAQDPQRLTTEQRKDQRGQRIFLDVARNAYGQTAITPYSLRARPGAPVATPLDWAELGRTEPGSYDAASVGRRLAHKHDPWAWIDESARSAASARDRAAGT